MEKKEINLSIGCGETFSTGSNWINLDYESQNSNVIECDILKKIPFKEIEQFTFVKEENLRIKIKELINIISSELPGPKRNLIEIKIKKLQRRAFL